MAGRGVCIVLGGAAGMGRQCVEKCVKCGVNVAFMDINKTAGKELKATLEAKYGVDVLFFHGDTEKEEDRELFERAAIAKYGRVEFLFCNVSSFILGKLER